MQIDSNRGTLTHFDRFCTVYADYALPFIFFGFVYAIFLVISKEVTEREEHRESLTSRFKKRKRRVVQLPRSLRFGAISLEKVKKVLKAQQQARKRVLLLFNKLRERWNFSIL